MCIRIIQINIMKMMLVFLRKLPQWPYHRSPRLQYVNTRKILEKSIHGRKTTCDNSALLSIIFLKNIIHSSFRCFVQIFTRLETIAGIPMSIRTPISITFGNSVNPLSLNLNRGQYLTKRPQTPACFPMGYILLGAFCLFASRRSFD